MTSPYDLFINELSNFIANTAYQSSTGDTTKLQDLDRLKLMAKAAGSFTADSLEKLRFVLTERLGLRDIKADQEIKKLRVIQAIGAYPADITEYIRLFMSQCGYRYCLVGNYVDEHVTEHSSGGVLNRLKTVNADLRLYRGEEINAAFSTCEENAHRDGFRQLLGQVAFDGVGRDGPIEEMLSTIVAADLWSNAEYRKAAIAVFRLWIWRVKTILAGRNTSEHIMPYLFGPQGCGKTTFTEWFLRPFHGAKMGAGLDLFDDNGKSYLIAKLPVIVFEETAFADRACVENIKQRMTEDHTMVRQLYMNASTQRVVASFFACSNRMLDEVIRDETGMRRFFQFTVKKVPYGTWSDQDPFRIWKCVDETQQQPPLTEDERAAIAKFQEAHRALGIVERWLDADVQFLDQNGWLNAEAKSTPLYNRFKEWCDEAGEKPISQHKWAKDLKKLDYVTDGSDRLGKWYCIEREAPEQATRPVAEILEFSKRINQ